MRLLPIKIGSLILLLVLSACSSTLQPPDLKNIYDRSAMYHGVERHPVIVIPGILGSKLIDTKDDLRVWGAWDAKYADPDEPESVRRIALPLKKDLAINNLQDSVITDGALDRVRISIFGIPFELNTYFNLLSTLGAGGFRDQGLGEVGAIDYGDDHFTCFQFAYDWRQSNVVNAARLHDFILEKKKYIQAEYEKRFGIKNYAVKFNIIAHSMGGLLTRYYLRYGNQQLPVDGSLPKLDWQGAKNVEKVFLIGTPNAGSVYSLHDLINGKKLAPVIPHYHAGILGTLPSVYELLPRNRHRSIVTNARGKEETLDIFDPQLWIDNQWGLLDPEQEFILEWLLPEIKSKNKRREIALERISKSLANAKQFHAALDLEAIPPKNLKINAIIGDAIKTYGKLEVLNKGEVKYAAPAQGDSIVTRASVLLDERIGGKWSPFLISPIAWNNILFLFTDHIGLTNNPIFSDNILYYLLEQPNDKTL